MLKFKDKLGNIRFLLRDSDTQPIDIDKLVIEQAKSESQDTEDTLEIDPKEKE